MNVDRVMESSPSTHRHPRVHQLVVPDVGVGCLPLLVSLWLVKEGSHVVEGDRVVELVCGGATVDLEAPVSGRLVRHLVDEDAPVFPGVVIAELETAGPA
jgi:pyruvate/2-oxoglutarate dehydrogenase complex dihydrolipoamide acyltransferase (E2) component